MRNIIKIKIIEALTKLLVNLETDCMRDNTLKTIVTNKLIEIIDSL